VLPVPKEERQAEDLHPGGEVLHVPRGDLGYVQAADLQQLQALPLGAQLLVGVDLQGQAPRREAVQVAAQLEHGPVHRMADVQPVGQFDGPCPPGGAAGGPQKGRCQYDRADDKVSLSHGQRPLISAMIPRAPRTFSSRALKSPLASSSPEINWEPIPTQVAPAENQAPRLSRVGETPPVGMISVQGCGPLMAFMNPGP